MTSRCARLAGLAIAIALVAPLPAAAHGIGGTNELPLPVWLMSWGATVVLAVSFVALGSLWRAPRFATDPRERSVRLPAARGAEVVLGALGVLAFGGLVYAGLAGSQNAEANLLPTSVYVVFWVGLPLASALAGDVFAPVNPWRAVGRGVGWVARRAGVTATPLPYPARLGHWPVVAGLVVFGWFELVSLDGDTPAVVARLAVLYAAVQLLGMALYGERAWTERGDAFAVYFRAFASLAPLRWERGRLALRTPLGGAARLDPTVFTAVVVTTMVGVTSYDGLSQSNLLGSIFELAVPALGDVGIDARLAPQVVGTIAYAAMLVAVWALYRVACGRMQRRPEGAGAVAAFAHTLVPIALAYVLAHYVGLLLFQGQAMAPLLSDPLGNGADYLGTADVVIDYTLISPQALWGVQVTVLVAGHVAGLVLAHDRALRMFPPARATRSQYPMLMVMIALTSLGLYLLSS